MPARQTKHRKLRSLRREGAAFVEALLVIGLIVVCLQCVWGVYLYCLFQHRARVEARQKAWESSLAGCEDPPMNGILSSLSRSHTSSEVSGLKSDSEEAPGWMQIGKGERSTVTLDLAEAVFGHATVGATEQFACNEQGGKNELEVSGGGPDADRTIHDATATQ